MDKGISPVVLILAMLTGGSRADELVLQLNGEVASYPESMIITKIQSGVIDPNPVVNERGLRYFVQIARNNVDLYFPTLGWQTIIPHGQFRRRLKAAQSPPLLSTPPPAPAPLSEGPQWARANGPRNLLHPSPAAGSRVVHGVAQERSAMSRGILPPAAQTTRQLFLEASGGVLVRPAPAVNDMGQSSAPYDGDRVASSTLTRRILQSQPQGPRRPAQTGGSGGVRSPVAAHERLVTDVRVMTAPSATVTPPASKPSETQSVATGQGSRQRESLVSASTVTQGRQRESLVSASTVTQGRQRESLVSASTVTQGRQRESLVSASTVTQGRKRESLVSASTVTQGRQRESLLSASTVTPVQQTTDKSVTASSAKSTRSQTTESTTTAATTITNQPLKTETTTSHTSD